MQNPEVVRRTMFGTAKVFNLQTDDNYNYHDNYHPNQKRMYTLTTAIKSLKP